MKQLRRLCVVAIFFLQYIKIPTSGLFRFNFGNLAIQNTTIAKQDKLFAIGHTC